MDWQQEAKYLQQQLDDERYERERQQERAYQEREEARRERQRAALEAQCYAESWEEAFAKGIARYHHEATDEIRMKASGDYPDFDDHFFQDELEQTLYAQEIYRDEMKKARELVAKIEQRARNKAAARVNEKYPDAHIVEYLREDNFSALVEW